jgi:hypothetical protein
VEKTKVISLEERVQDEAKSYVEKLLSDGEPGKCFRRR